MQGQEKFDYIVVGAGPAGSAFALQAGDKLRILLLDGSFRGQKPCGGLLAPQAARALAEMGLTLPREVLADPQIFAVRTMDLQTGAERSYPRNYVNMDRAAFDGWLRRLAGAKATVLQARATAVRPLEQGGWAVDYVTATGERETAQGAAVVGADGAGGIVRRSCFAERRILHYTAIQQWFTLRDAPLYACVFHRPTSESCSWLFCKDRKLAFGGAFAPSGARAGFEEQKRILQEQYGFSMAQPLRTEACVVYRPRSKRDLCLGAGGVYLLGEAAGLISPSSFEGISYALRSGCRLAEAALAGGEVGKNYRRAAGALCREVLSRRWKRPFMYWPKLRGLVLKSGVQALKGSK